MRRCNDSSPIEGHLQVNLPVMLVENEVVKM